MRARSEQASFLPRFVPSYRLSWLPARRSGTKFPAKEMDLRRILPQLFPSSCSPRAKNSFASKLPNNVGTHEHRDIRSLPDFHLSHYPNSREHKNQYIIGNSLITIIALQIRRDRCTTLASPFSDEEHGSMIKCQPRLVERYCDYHYYLSCGGTKAECHSWWKYYGSMANEFPTIHVCTRCARTRYVFVHPFDWIPNGITVTQPKRDRWFSKV